MAITHASYDFIDRTFLCFILFFVVLGGVVAGYYAIDFIERSYGEHLSLCVGKGGIGPI